MDRRTAVFDALDHAMANGYDMRLWSDDDIATDLGLYDSELEGLSADELHEHIVSWKAAHPGESK